MTNESTSLTDLYQDIEARFNVERACESYSELVTAKNNQSYPIQRWFHLKESFSLQLLDTILSNWNIEFSSIRRILDPFCGIGTSLLAVQSLAKKYEKKNIEVIGFERNPFLHFVARTKLNWAKYDRQQIKARATYLLDGSTKPDPRSIPSLSTLHREEIYDKDVLKTALSFRDAIYLYAQNPMERDLLLLGFASILEDISGARKDGRALRIEPSKRRSEVLASLDTAWKMIADDLEVAEQYYSPISSQVLLGDGRILQPDEQGVRELGNFDLILYSPPYLNNIDYTEVYKVELWMCGFVRTKEEFRQLRYKTFRSHPSVRFTDPIIMTEDKRMKDVNYFIDALIQYLPKDKNFYWRTDLFKGYFDDMYVSLKHQMNVLSPGGWIFCVVGNSLHGPKNDPASRVTVAADLFIALIAQALGLEVKAIQVARYLKRRPPYSRFLRESIVALRKPI